MLPNFLIIGAAKAGTTSLNAYLQQHPQVFMTPTKETYYFTTEGTPPNYQGPHEHANQHAIFRLEDYQAQFEQAGNALALGEACPAYLYDDAAPSRIHALLPSIKLVAVLRQPADRAHSGYMHMVRGQHETARDFANALDQEDQRIEAYWGYMWHYRRVGCYLEQLKRYHALFPATQIRTYLHEDLEANPSAVTKDIFAFLGVDDKFEPETSLRYNATGTARSTLLRDLIMKQSKVKSLYKRLVPNRKLRNKLAAPLYRHAFKKERLDPELRTKLTAGYRDEILELGDFIDRDLTAWLN